MSSREDIIEVTSFGDSPFFVFCDHATNHIPDRLENLGLDDQKLASHIAWDIGAKAVSISIAQKIRCSIQCCQFSRLVIDPNRSPTDSASIPISSDGVVIAGNVNLSAEKKDDRVRNYYEPYHDALKNNLDRFCAFHVSDALFVISIHSFTNKLASAQTHRPWDIGLLWREDEESALAAIDFLTTNSNMVIGNNQPYDGVQFSHTIDRHVGPRRIRHLTFEVRQNLIDKQQGIDEIASILVPTILNTAEQNV